MRTGVDWSTITPEYSSKERNGSCLRGLIQQGAMGCSSKFSQSDAVKMAQPYIGRHVFHERLSMARGPAGGFPL